MGFVGRKPTNAPLVSSDLGTGIVGSTNIADNAVLTGNIADNAVLTGKIADGTITLDDLSATGTKDATTFLRGDNTFASAGGANTPAWSVTTNGSSQSVTVNSRTIVQFNTENFDLGSVFNTTTYKATPTSGKYFLSANVTMKPTAGGVYQMWIQIMKNTTTIAKQGYLLSSAEYESAVGQSYNCSVAATANGTDTFHVEVYYYNGTAEVMAIDGNAPQNFSGIKIIE